MPSTVIADMAYDPETQTLSVWFRPSGRRYDYFEVPSVVFDALRHSPSKGRYFNAHIRNGYEFAQSERGLEPHFSDRSQNIAHHRHAGTR
ncbi:KTSC domain-containing protein [Devosia sp. CN2-171]|uniref:KTSC domain-containing protein n=1 Tax=Devosia sp. CN2-171 TaxID=3400909 RepID=UPI003BF84234